jgi:hypothetical protein
MVELALTLPILLLLITGIYSVGMLLQQDMQLTDSVNVGAMDLAINGSGLGSGGDPCALAAADIINTSPFLDASKMTFTFVLNNTSYSSSGNSCSGVTLSSGSTMQVTATYPCSITIYLAPAVQGCLLSASLSEIVQ